MTEKEYKKIYAVDFDGTIAETKFPEIIAPIWSMVQKCKKIKKDGDILILWTCRCGKDLEDAIDYCAKLGIKFDYINENVPENVEKFGNDCRKIFAHEYIDDKSWSPKREKEWLDRFARLKRTLPKRAAIVYGIAVAAYVITVFLIGQFGIR